MLNPVPPLQRSRPRVEPGGTGWTAILQPRNFVFLALLVAVGYGGGRKLMQGLRARRTLARLDQADVTAAEIEGAASTGRDALAALFHFLSPDQAASRRQAAARALAQLWRADELVAEEEKALVTRAVEVEWHARRRYPRALQTPLPFEVRFGLPFLAPPLTIGPEQLEWSWRIRGSHRASLETFTPWQPSPQTASFTLDPKDFEGPGPHALAFHTRVRTLGLTSSWELELPQVPFRFELDPRLEPSALFTLPDEARARQLAQSLSLAPPEGDADDRYLPLDPDFALRNPPSLVVAGSRPCDLAHALMLELEGLNSPIPAGDLSAPADASDRIVPLLPVASPAPRLDRPGEYVARLVLVPETELAWQNPELRSVWPEPIVAGEFTAQVVRR